MLNHSLQCSCFFIDVEGGFGISREVHVLVRNVDGKLHSCPVDRGHIRRVGPLGDDGRWYDTCYPALPQRNPHDERKVRTRYVEISALYDMNSLFSAWTLVSVTVCV